MIESFQILTYFLIILLSFSFSLYFLSNTNNEKDIFILLKNFIVNTREQNLLKTKETLVTIIGGLLSNHFGQEAFDNFHY